MIATLIIALALGAGVNEPPPDDFTFTLHHCTSGQRLILYECLSPRLERYATLRDLTITRDRFGRCIELRVSEDGYTGRKSRVVYGRHARWLAVWRFLAETGIEDETVAFRDGDNVRNVPLSRLLDHETALEDSALYCDEADWEFRSGVFELQLEIEGVREVCYGR